MLKHSRFSTRLLVPADRVPTYLVIQHRSQSQLGPVRMTSTNGRQVVAPSGRTGHTATFLLTVGIDIAIDSNSRARTARIGT
jgi:hypothetical protein